MDLMGLDITLHRKDAPDDKYFWVNGRMRFGAIRDLMVEKYNYQYGKDLLITKEIIIDLLNITHANIIISDEFDLSIYMNFYADLLYVYNTMIYSNENWYFEATW